MRVRKILIILVAIIFGAVMVRANNQNPNTNNMPSKKTNGGRIMKHELPPLPYDYDALEPYYDEATLRVHHDKHHLAYVNGLNKAEEKLAEARAAGDYSLIQHWERQLAFHSAGHILHTIFWHNMAPKAEGQPGGDLMEQIKKDFGSFENFKKQFSEAAVSVEGNGWTVLGWQPEFEKLYIYNIENHQKQLTPGMQPLLVLDVWEHAYYLKHQNRRAEWVESWWHIVNWQDVSARFADVLRLRKPAETIMKSSM